MQTEILATLKDAERHCGVIPLPKLRRLIEQMEAQPAPSIGQALAPVLAQALQKEQAAEVAADLETINEWRGVYPHSDDGIMAHVVRRLGIEGAFTFEALALMADEYRRAARQRERTREHNRRIWQETDHA